MENNLAELKKEYLTRFTLGRYFKDLAEPETIWQWFSSKLNEYVPKSEYEELADGLEDEVKVMLKLIAAKMKIERLETNIAALKAENENLTDKVELQELQLMNAKAMIVKLDSQLSEAKAENERLANANINLKQATHAISKKCFSLQDKIEILEANAENEKLSAQRNNGKVVVQHLDGDFEEYDSYQEAKESILESYNDKHEGIHPDIECIKVLQEIFTIEVVSDELIQARQEERARIVEILTTYGRNNALNTHCAEIIKAITADQPTQKSCEGCEYNLDNNESWICTSCKDFSNYQPKEK